MWFPPVSMIRAIRVIIKTLTIAIFLALALLQFAGLLLFRKRMLLHRRAAWLRTWCGWVLKILAVRVDFQGETPRSGLVVANHLSYLDILVFSSIAPAIFVAKIEVKSWPVIGLMARLGGAIFTDRRRLKLLPKTIAQVESALRAGVLVVIFPESTTTDGSHMLPFRPALFEAAVRANADVSSAHIRYTDDAGNFARNLCWFGEVNMVRHLAGAFAMRSIMAKLRVAPNSVCYGSRKTAALATFNEVAQLGSDKSGKDRLHEEVASIGGQPSPGAAPCD